MYYTGIDPRNGKEVYVCRNPHEKAMQRALIQYRNPNNYDLVREALIKGGREDLIGFDKKCLIRPRKMNTGGMNVNNAGKNDGRANSSKGKSKSGTNRSSAKSGKKKTIRNIHKKK